MLRGVLAPALSAGMHVMLVGVIAGAGTTGPGHPRPIEVEILAPRPRVLAPPSVDQPARVPRPGVAARRPRPAPAPRRPEPEPDPPSASTPPPSVAPVVGPAPSPAPVRSYLASPVAAPPQAGRAGAPGDLAAERLIDAEQATTPPMLLSSVRAEYPEEARQQGVEVDVTLSITVRSDGTVARVRVLAPAGLGFDEAAEAAARRFRFRPALLGSAPVAVRLRWVYQFRLERRAAHATSRLSRARVSRVASRSRPRMMRT